MKFFVIGLLAISSISAFADVPRTVGCEIRLRTSKLLSSASEKKPTLDELVETAKDKIIIRKVETVSSDTVVVKMFKGSLEAYYSFNTQSGQISLYDTVNGLSSQANWTQDYENIGTGYIDFLTTELTKISGNLFGIKNAFNVSVRCNRYIK